MKHAEVYEYVQRYLTQANDVKLLLRSLDSSLLFPVAH